MTKPEMTYEIAWAIATDYANSKMRKAARSSWNLSDYQAACSKLTELCERCDRILVPNPRN